MEPGSVVIVVGTVVVGVIELTRPPPAVPEFDAGTIENGEVGLVGAEVDVVPPPGGVLPPKGCVVGGVVRWFGGSAV